MQLIATQWLDRHSDCSPLRQDLLFEFVRYAVLSHLSSRKVLPINPRLHIFDDISTLKGPTSQSSRCLLQPRWATKRMSDKRQGRCLRRKLHPETILVGTVARSKERLMDLPHSRLPQHSGRLSSLLLSSVFSLHWKILLSPQHCPLSLQNWIYKPTMSGSQMRFS